MQNKYILAVKIYLYILLRYSAMFWRSKLDFWRSKYRAIAIQEGVLSELADIMLLINLIKKEKCNSTNPINQK